MPKDVSTLTTEELLAQVEQPSVDVMRLYSFYQGKRDDHV